MVLFIIPRQMYVLILFFFFNYKASVTCLTLSLFIDSYKAMEELGSRDGSTRESQIHI